MCVEADGGPGVAEGGGAGLQYAPQLVFIKLFGIGGACQDFVLEGDLGVLVDSIQFMCGRAQSLDSMRFDFIHSQCMFTNFLFYFSL